MPSDPLWRHDPLARDLARFLASKSDRLVFENTPIGPSGSPRPDVYTVAKSYNLRPITYEVKVSSADFRSDITSGKWQSYLEFSSAVIFAAPKGLISKDDLPNGVGLIQRGEETWRTLKGPKLNSFSLSETVLIKLLLAATDQRRDYLTRGGWSNDEWLRRESEEKAFKSVGRRYGVTVATVCRDTEKAKRHLEAVTKEAHAIEAAAYRDADHFREEGGLALREVAKLLGIQEHASLSDIKFRWQKRLERFRDEAHIADLREQVQDLVRKFDAVSKSPLLRRETDSAEGPADATS